jgi:hypothetical protein
MSGNSPRRFADPAALTEAGSLLRRTAFVAACLFAGLLAADVYGKADTILPAVLSMHMAMGTAGLAIVAYARRHVVTRNPAPFGFIRTTCLVLMVIGFQMFLMSTVALSVFSWFIVTGQAG